MVRDTTQATKSSSFLRSGLQSGISWGGGGGVQDKYAKECVGWGQLVSEALVSYWCLMGYKGIQSLYLHNPFLSSLIKPASYGSFPKEGTQYTPLNMIRDPQNGTPNNFEKSHISASLNPEP